ncbi:hypothetical protein AB0B31_23400 [Catellatospora citrea]|uniref:hypothetical protein n=1 Tax=Catellatospora citrea TaxID=53366 RepID=UPI0033D63D3E
MVHFSPTGWVAQYASNPFNNLPCVVYREVHTWAADGAALVVDEQKGSLVLATSLPDFEGLHYVERLVGAVAAPPGWYQRTRVPGLAEPVIEPVAVWLVTGHGHVLPVGRNEGLPFLAPGGMDFREGVDIFFEPDAQAVGRPSGGTGEPEAPPPPF